MNSFFNSDGPIFMGAQREVDNCKIGIYGVEYDGTTSFRPGTRFGPSAIRTASHGLETFCPEQNQDLSELNYSDFGCLNITHGAPEPIIEKVEQTTEKLIGNNIKPLLLGGEHSITEGAVKAFSRKHENLIIFQLDAHADFRDEWLGSNHNHACVMRRCLENLSSKTIFQVGIRSGTREEFNELKERKQYFPLSSVEERNNLFEALKIYTGNPIYLTIDLDWFDPGIMPGTGTPEPGGFSWNDFSLIINILKYHRIVGADVVELAPQLDSSGISSILAAKVVRSLIILLSKTQ